MNAPIASSMRREGSFIHEWHPEDQERIGHRVDIAGNWVLISIVPVIFRTLHERLLAVLTSLARWQRCARPASSRQR